ncbi:hypothetical protein BSKO_04982 [Bryopsis sp. KO-2023]|nr:hypothetical protein BSKO_04982 [Bryopsis sp. KO-2023]
MAADEGDSYYDSSGSDSEDAVGDDNGKKLYLRLCDENNVMPISQVVRYLDQGEIQLTRYGIGLRALVPLAKALEVNQSIVTLRLGDNGLNDAAVGLILRALAINTRIQEVDLSMNQMGLAGANSIAELLLSKDSNLTSLNLSHNKLPDKGGAAIVDALYSNTTLTELNLSNNKLAEKTAIALSNSLQVNNVLRHLNVSWNAFRSRGVAAIAEGLTPNLSIQSVDVSWTGVQDAGAEAIGTMLAGNQGLAEIIMSGNGITAIGAQQISQGIQGNDVLASVGLDQNDLRDEGGLAIKAALVENRGSKFTVATYMCR